MPRDQLIIKKSFLVLCEGIDTFNFLCCYLNSPVLHCDSRFSNDIQICNFKGISELTAFISNLQKMDNYTEVNRIVVLRDAERDVQGAIQSIKSSLDINNLPIPDCCNEWKSSDDDSMRVAYTLLPTCNNEPTVGALEDLCWDILNLNDAQSIKEDIQVFLQSIIHKYNSIGSHEHKSRLHTYLSVNKDYISLKIGEAAKAGAFNWEHEKLNALKQLLSDGF